MEISQKRGTPKSPILVGFYHYKPSIWGYPHLAVPGSAAGRPYVRRRPKSGDAFGLPDVSGRKGMGDGRPGK